MKQKFVINNNAYYMTKTEFKDIADYSFPFDFEGRKQSLKVIIDLSLKILNESYSKYYNPLEKDLIMLYQMVISKSIYIYNLSEPINYTNNFDLNSSLPKHLDSLPLYSILRSALEKYCIFNHISFQEKNKSEFSYFIWVLSGLLERQNFDNESNILPHRIKAIKERQQISELFDKIMFHEVTACLSDNELEKLKKFLKKRKFKIKLVDNKVIVLGWNDIIDNIGINKVFSQQLYKNLSNKSHPSNLSVFQFASSFDGKTNLNEVSLILFQTKMILTLFIDDICRNYSLAEESFNKLDIEDQLFIDFNCNILKKKES